ncbi:hypothetical protein Prudu_002137 [Prunus dulcis]|uniref:Uncharacterized protein n=1 Tax=Prunus dulcis TaxID=3755 RepID=A0A4Y1QQ63_PRUDU|nr:hypothetical protein Prudu_002137 [Prunus dulcis]
MQLLSAPSSNHWFSYFIQAHSLSHKGKQFSASVEEDYQLSSIFLSIFACPRHKETKTKQNEMLCEIGQGDVNMEMEFESQSKGYGISGSRVGSVSAGGSGSASGSGGVPHSNAPPLGREDHLIEHPRGGSSFSAATFVFFHHGQQR